FADARRLLRFVPVQVRGVLLDLAAARFVPINLGLKRLALTFQVSLGLGKQTGPAAAEALDLPLGGSGIFRLADDFQAMLLQGERFLGQSTLFLIHRGRAAEALLPQGGVQPARLDQLSMCLLKLVGFVPAALLPLAAQVI